MNSQVLQISTANQAQRAQIPKTVERIDRALPAETLQSVFGTKGRFDGRRVAESGVTSGLGMTGAKGMAVNGASDFHISY